MTSGIRIEVSARGLRECRVAPVSEETDSEITSVVKTTGCGERVTEEFTIEGNANLSREDVTEIAAYENLTTYRFQRPRDTGCLCERIEAAGHPVSEVHAADGALHVSFHTPNLEAARTVVKMLRESFADISLRKLTRTDGESKSEPVLVDRNHLTSRQHEVLQTAHKMGYLEHPKEANAGEVADALGIAPATFSEHLAAAQRKLLEEVLSA